MAELGIIRDLKVINPNQIHHLLEDGELGAVLEWQVSDTKTGEVKEHVAKKSESFLQQFLQLLFMQMVYSPVDLPLANVRDTSNTLRSIFGQIAPGGGSGGFNLDVNSGAGVVTYGIITGTGNTAPTISDYVLQTPIANGGGAGQFNYSTHTFGAPAADSTTSQVTITRNMANASGGGITVNEVGMYARSFDGTQRFFAIIRDVIGGGISVPNGQTLTVNYRLQAVV